MVNIFADTHMPFKDLIEPVIRGYNQLSEEEQKEFCSWLAGPDPKEKKMCEYCTTEYYKRNPYLLKGDMDNEAEVTLRISSEDGLHIYAEWYDELRKDKMCFAALAQLRYCPWCGRKLEEKK